MICPLGVQLTCPKEADSCRATQPDWPEQAARAGRADSYGGGRAKRSGQTQNRQALLRSWRSWISDPAPACGAKAHHARLSLASICAPKVGLERQGPTEKHCKIHRLSKPQSETHLVLAACQRCWSSLHSISRSLLHSLHHPRSRQPVHR